MKDETPKRWTIPVCSGCRGILGFRAEGGCSCDSSLAKTGKNFEVVESRLLKAIQERAEKAERSKEFTEQWYAERIRRIEDTAKREGIWPEIACILANGTAEAAEPHTYAEQLNLAKHRAEQAEQKLKAERERLEGALHKLQNGPHTLTQDGLQIVLQALYPGALNSSETEGAGRG